MANKKDKYLDIDSLRKALLKELEFRKSYLNEFSGEPNEPQPIYILASTYQIAKSIFDHYFRHTGLSQFLNFRYIDEIYKVYGIRNVYIIVSQEGYPTLSFHERLGWVRQQAEYRDFEIIYEQDLEKEQVRQKVSRQRPKASKSE